MGEVTIKFKFCPYCGQEITCMDWYRMDNYEHDILEKAMMAFFGEDYYNWQNKRTEQHEARM